MYTTRRLREAESARAGFTLLEVLVALMVSGLVVGSIFQVLRGTAHFVELQASREEVQQNARAALDLIAGDLRGVPPGAFVEMEADRIRFMQPRAWGVLCATLAPTDLTAWVIVPEGMVSVGDFLERSHRGLGVEQSGDPLVRTGRYRFVSGLLRETSGDRCDVVQPFPSAGGVRIGLGSPGAPFVTGDSVPAGSLVMLYEELAYDVAVSGGTGGGRWIRRMAGYGASRPNMQPMAGPVPDGAGLTFGYLSGDGATAATVADSVRRVTIEVVVRSRGVEREGARVRPQQVDTARTTVHLRNVPR